MTGCLCFVSVYDWLPELWLGSDQLPALWLGV